MNTDTTEPSSSLGAELIVPIWPAPSNIVAGVSTRQGGFSNAPYNSLNLAHHVDDKLSNVARNRCQLESLCQSSTSQPTHWQWLNQTHGTDIAIAEKMTTEAANADALCTAQPSISCAVLTADCLPILLCDQLGSRVAAIHAGWRGLANGIVAHCINQFANSNRHWAEIPRSHIYAWLGPAIGPDHFEVGEEVKTAFVSGKKNASEYSAAFVKTSHQKYLADIYQLATLALRDSGVHHIYGGGFCTYCESERFYSFRRDKLTGRMASFIFMNNPAS